MSAMHGSRPHLNRGSYEPADPSATLPEDINEG